MATTFSFNCFNHSTFLGLPPSLPAQIAAAAGAGYDRIGLDVPSLLAHEAAGTSPEAVRGLLDEHGIPCFELVAHSVSGHRSADDRSLADVARLAPLVGARHVLAAVRRPVDDDVAGGFRRAVATLADLGVGLSVEFMPISPLPSLEAAVGLLDRVGDDRLGVVVDVWHLALSGSREATLAALGLDRIGFVQLGDAPADAVGTSVVDCMDRRELPGDGVLPIRALCTHLADRGWDGVVSVEVLSAPWRDRALADFASSTLAAARGAWRPR